MDNFSRSNVNIANQKIGDLIIDWTGKKNQSLGVFCKLLKSIGIAMPITVSNLNDRINSFDCVTGDGKIISLSLGYGKDDNLNTISVKENDLCSHYDYLCPVNRLKLHYTELEINNFHLYTFYYEDCCKRFLILPDNYYVTIDVVNPCSPGIQIFNNMDAINNYLLSLTFPCTAQEIYKRVMQLYGFNDKIVSAIEYIEVSVEKIISVDEDGNILDTHKFSMIFLEHGKISKYFINEGDIVYGINKNGDWHYSTSYICCDFTIKNNRLSATIEASPEIACTINIADIINIAREKVNSIKGKID